MTAHCTVSALSSLFWNKKDFLPPLFLFNRTKLWMLSGRPSHRKSQKTAKMRWLQPFTVQATVPCIIVTNSAVCSFPPFRCPPCLLVDPARLIGNRFYFTNSREMKLINQDIERCPPLLHSLQTSPFSRVFQNMKKFCTRHYLFKNFKNIPSFKKKCLVLPLEVYTVNIAL